MSNLLINHNPTFDPSWGGGMTQHPDHANIFIPAGWEIGWLEGEPFPGIHNDPPTLVAHRPEAVIINEWAGLEPELTPDDSYTWKIFVQNCLYTWISLREPLNLPAGMYVLQLKVWPKLHMVGEPGNPHPGDPWAAEVGLCLQAGEIQWRNNLDYARYTYPEWQFNHPGGPLNLTIHLKGKYPIDNSFFLHWVAIPGNTDPPPPVPGPNGTLELGPLTLTYLERIATALEGLAGFDPGVPTPPEPEPVALVPWSQNDPRWKDLPYNPPTPTTFGQAGCLVCAYASIASLTETPAPPPPEFARQLSRVGAFNGAMLSHPARIPDAYPNLEWGGVLHWRTVPADMHVVQRELTRHGAIVCEVKWNPDGPSPEQGNQHFIVVTAMVGDDALIIDPWDGEQKLLSTTRYRKPGWTVARTLYGARLLRPRQESPAPPPPNPLALRGTHGAPTYYPPADINSWVARLRQLGIRWYKLLDDGGTSNNAFIHALRTADIQPVVRLYQARQFPGRLAPTLRTRLTQLAALGVTYVEIGNEPNLPGEWGQGSPDWHNQAQIQAVASSWWADAQLALQAGLSPALYALAPTERGRGTHPTSSSLEWQRRLCAHLRQHVPELPPLLSSGKVWLAVHTADFGLPFAYPVTTEQGTDDMCLLGYTAHQEIVRENFGLRPLIISTEGGVYSPEHLADLTFPVTYTESQWGARLVAMYEFLAQRGDLLAMCPWTFSDEGAPQEWHNCGWYRANGSARSPIAALQI